MDKNNDYSSRSLIRLFQYGSFMIGGMGLVETNSMSFPLIIGGGVIYLAARKIEDIYYGNNRPELENRLTTSDKSK